VGRGSGTGQAPARVQAQNSAANSGTVSAISATRSPFADAGVDQAVGHLQRIGAHFGIGIDPLQFAAHVVEVEALLAARGVIDRIVERGEIRTDTRQRAIVRRGNEREHEIGHEASATLIKRPPVCLGLAHPQVRKPAGIVFGLNRNFPI